MFLYDLQAPIDCVTAVADSSSGSGGGCWLGECRCNSKCRQGRHHLCGGRVSQAPSKCKPLNLICSYA